MATRAALILTAIVLLTGPSAGQELRETIVAELGDSTFIEGRLDWGGQSLLVYGEGAAPDGVDDPVRRRLMGFRAAKVAAYRNLLEIVGQVHVDSRTTVTMAMVSGDSIRQRVEGLVRGARVVAGSRQEEGGLFRLAVQLDLLGGLTDAVLPGEESSVGELADPNRELPPNLPESDSLLVFVPSRPYTGLVIDARGTGLRPTMAPRIVDETGRVIYSAGNVNRDYAIEFGVAGYESDIQQAVVSDRVGGAEAHAFIVPALTSTGLFGGDAVVDRDQGVRILMANTEARFLTECRVVFVVGPPPEPARPAFEDTVAGDSMDAFFDIIMGSDETRDIGPDSLGFEAAPPDLPSGVLDP